MAESFYYKLERLGISRGTNGKAELKYQETYGDEEDGTGKFRLSGDYIFYGNEAGDVYKINKSDGSVVWVKNYTDTEIWAISTYKNEVYLGDYAPSGTIYSINKSDGSVNWQTSLGTDNNDITSAVATEDYVLYSNLDNGVEGGGAVDRTNGDKIWSKEFTEPRVAYDTGAGEGKFFVGATNVVAAYDADTGDVIWEYQPKSTDTANINKDYFGTVRYNDGKLYVASDGGGDVLVMNASNGSVLYTHDFHGIGSYVTDVFPIDGLIYSVSSNNGTNKVVCATDENPPRKVFSHKLNRQNAQFVYGIAADEDVVYSSTGAPTFNDNSERYEITAAIPTY